MNFILSLSDKMKLVIESKLRTKDIKNIQKDLQEIIDFLFYLRNEIERKRKTILKIKWGSLFQYTKKSFNINKPEVFISRNENSNVFLPSSDYTRKELYIDTDNIKVHYKIILYKLTQLPLIYRSVREEHLYDIFINTTELIKFCKKTHKSIDYLPGNK